jgi:hypothetical protein
MHTYEEELELFDIVVLDHSSIKLDDLKDNLIPFGCVLILKLIDRVQNKFISEDEFNDAYDRIVTYIHHVDLMGYSKTFGKLTQEIVIDVLHEKPFVVYAK